MNGMQQPKWTKTEYPPTMDIFQNDSKSLRENADPFTINKFVNLTIILSRNDEKRLALLDSGKE